MKRRILFVDDEPMVLRGLQRTLRKMRQEWDMTFASSGCEALDVLSKKPMDVIVSDLRMPEMDGGLLMAEVKKRHPNVVRIILSGQLDQEMTLKSVKLVHQSLSKPCDAQVLKHTLAKLFALRDFLSDESIKSIVSQIESLPSLPSIYTEIVTEMQSDDPSIKKVGEIISKDPSMTAKILQMVNSAFFGLFQKIKSPEQAVMMLGSETIKALVISAKIFSEFNQKSFAWFNIDELFDHCLAVSLYAKTIVKNENLDQGLINNSMMAGLLHDIGKLILATNFEKSYRQVLAAAQDNGKKLLDLEYDAFGTSHAEIGAYLMGLWRLDNAIIEAIAFHHFPARSMTRNIGLLTAVHVGNAMDHEARTPTAEAADLQYDTEYLDKLEIKSRIPQWHQVCKELTERNGQ
ncbi:MAG: response regulator [Desulfobacterales bacterium]|jgi:putative nucleotidyltransferase with HDIG domain